MVSCNKNKVNSASLKTTKKTIIINDIEKKSLWDFNYTFGEKRINSDDLHFLSKDLLKKEYNNIILSMDLYIDFNVSNEWIISKKDIMNIGIYTLKDNKIIFDYFDLQKSKIIFNAKNLSDIYCDAIIPFLIDNPNLKREKLSLITFILNKSEMPDFNTLNLSLKENDTVHKLLREIVKKYKSP